MLKTALWMENSKAVKSGDQQIVFKIIPNYNKLSIQIFHISSIFENHIFAKMHKKFESPWTAKTGLKIESLFFWGWKKGLCFRKMLPWNLVDWQLC